MTDVPFNYVDQEDFQTYKDRRVVYLFTTDFDKMGVVEYYLDTDGVKHYSEPTFWYRDATAIQNAAVSEQGRQPVSAVYRDLGGRIVSQPRSGIYLHTVTYADGSTKTQKVMLK